MTNQLPIDQRRPGILVVDDDEQVLQLVAACLRGRGLEVWTARGAQEAVECHRQHAQRLDLVLLDIQMPSVDGPGTLKALRQTDPRLRFCFMTGDSGGYRLSDLLAMGALDIFIKPFDLPAFGDAVSQLIGQPGALMAAPESGCS